VGYAAADDTLDADVVGYGLTVTKARADSAAE